MPSLYEALQKLQQLDDDDELDLITHLEAIEATKDKVDAYKNVLDQLEAQSIFWREKVKEAQTQARRADKMIERIKERMIYCLNAFETNELVGNIHRVKLSYSKKVELLREPQADDLFVHENLLRHKFEWDKKEITQAIEQGVNVDDFAKLVSSPSIRWSYASRSPARSKSNSRESESH